MIRRKIGDQGRIHLTKKVMEELELKKGDFVDIEVYPLEVRRRT